MPKRDLVTVIQGGVVLPAKSVFALEAMTLVLATRKEARHLCRPFTKPTKSKPLP